MIARWIDLCARNRFLVFAGTLFLVLAGIWAERWMPLDALPDISDVQVIVHTAWDEPPNVIEDQVTYPIVTAVSAAPNVKAVRAQTMFGDSYVFVVFEDGTDPYWARSRVLEYLQQIAGRLPAGVIRRSVLTRPARAGCMSTSSWITTIATVLPICAASRIGFSAIRSRRFQGWRKSRASAVLSGSTRSGWTLTSSAPLTSRSRR